MEHTPTPAEAPDSVASVVVSGTSDHADSMAVTADQRLRAVMSHLGGVLTCPNHNQGSDTFDSRFCENGCCCDDVLVAVNLSRLNGQEAYFVAGILGIAEHEHAAILRAPRIAADWLLKEGTYRVMNSEPTPEPVQIIEHDVDQACLETAVILWNPLELGSVYSNFEVAVDAAIRVLKDDT